MSTDCRFRSYTYSHTLDEQSALGLFYNGTIRTIPDPRMETPTLTGRTFGPWSINYELPSRTAAHGGKNNYQWLGVQWRNSFAKRPALQRD